MGRRGGRETEREVGPRLGQAQVQVVKRHLLSMALRPQCRQNRGPDRRGPQLFGPYKSRWQWWHSFNQVQPDQSLYISLSLSHTQCLWFQNDVTKTSISNPGVGKLFGLFWTHWVLKFNDNIIIMIIILYNLHKFDCCNLYRNTASEAGVRKRQLQLNVNLTSVSNFTLQTTSLIFVYCTDFLS